MKTEPLEEELRMETAQTHEKPAAKEDPIAAVREMVRACMQCGTCTGSCPNAFAMDMTPRRLWRLVSLGSEEEVFASRTFGLCSACYTCSLRCPRGLPLTDAMAALQQAAAGRDLPQQRSGERFYGSFVESVRRHGRVREMEFMTLYFAAMKNPLLPLRFSSLGLRLMRRGKVRFQLPGRGAGKLEGLFRTVREMDREP